MGNVLKLVSCTALVFAVSALTGTAKAQDRIDHFKGEPAPTLAQALQNLQEYNAKLTAILGGELTPTKMAEIHQITYTLENALERIQHDLAELAETLEEVHVASETMEYTVVQEAGKLYLEVANTLVKAP